MRICPIRNKATTKARRNKRRGSDWRGRGDESTYSRFHEYIKKKKAKYEPNQRGRFFLITIIMNEVALKDESAENKFRYNAELFKNTDDYTTKAISFLYATVNNV